MSAVGMNVPRKDGIAKATGAARYADDLTFPGMLFGRTIRSTIPRGRIRNIRLDFDTAGFTIVDHRDIPGRNAVDLMEKDQPFLAEHEVRHTGGADSAARAWESGNAERRTRGHRIRRRTRAVHGTSGTRLYRTKRRHCGAGW